MNFTIKRSTNKALKENLSRIPNYNVHQETVAGVVEILKTDHEIISAKFINNKELVAKDQYKLTCNTTIENVPKQLLLSGTDFQIKVWKATLEIPEGKTVTYQELAQMIGHPKSFRAVANALGQNKIAYFIPCHRVIRKNGELGGYKWGIEIKKALLDFEKLQS